MASTAQQVDDTYGRNMNTCFKLNKKKYMFLSSKCYQNIFKFYQLNKFLKSKLPNFTAKLTIH